jgi:hypothetical protein
MQVASHAGSIRWDSDTPTVCENGTAYHGVFRGFSPNNIDAARQAPQHPHLHVFGEHSF